MVEEIWKTIPDCPGYEASSLGRIRSLYKKKPPRVLKPYTGNHGYLVVCIFDANGNRRVGLVHRFVLEAFRGKNPSAHARHLNNIRHDNRIKNLRWGTKSENERDKRRHGTSPTGSRHHHALLTEDKVREIRRTYDGRLKETAKAYGVSKWCILKIMARKNWKHVE